MFSDIIVSNSYVTGIATIDLTILDEAFGRLVFLMHEPQVKSSTISNFIVGIVKASSEEHINTSLDFRVLLTDAELRQCSDGGGSNNRIFENYSVIDIADVFGWL